MEEPAAGEPGPARAAEVDQACSTATSSGGESSDPLSDYFIRHKLTKMDTLAGLAVRYNVTVSDIKRANGLLADSAMFAKDTLLIPTRPMPIGPEYSTWAGMIVTHYGRLGTSGDNISSESPYAQFSPTRGMHQLRGYYSTGPSRTESPKFGGPGAADDDSDQHHLFASGRPAGWGSAAGQPQQVELMERTGLRAAASYIEERLRRRGGSSQQEPADQPPSSSGAGGGSGAEGGASFAFFNRAPLFGGGGSGGSGGSGGGGASTSQAAALASAGGRQLLQWKDSLLHKLKKAASQPALAVPHGAGPSSVQQLGQAAVASAPLALAGGSGDTRQERQPLRQRTAAAGVRKSD